MTPSRSAHGQTETCSSPSTSRASWATTAPASSCWARLAETPGSCARASDFIPDSCSTMRASPVRRSVRGTRGPRAPRRLRRAGLARTVEQLAGLSIAARAALPGVSAGRAHQLLAGAIVAHEALDVLGLDEVAVCPWALREGVILRRLDWLAGA